MMEAQQDPFITRQAALFFKKDVRVYQGQKNKTTQQRQANTGKMTAWRDEDVQLVGSQEDKPLPRGIPGGIFGILGVVAAAALIISVAVTVFIVYRRQQKGRSDTDNDLIDLPPSHKPAPPPPKRKQEMKSHLTAEDIQVVHLDNMKEPEEEIQKLPPQPPYYDMAATEPTPHSDKMNFGKRHTEIPDAGDYLSCRYSREDQYLARIPYVYSPLSYLPEDAYSSRHSEASFCCPPPGSRAPYICPKEQYV
ncbi:uncharacterized protein LOC117060067 [Lacerta agilis]|uniref:uncharacterized protein LOC117060067 n=1 Tax=Lacerta agilis TaxID=80427 RepID=UPI00141A3960|nr:uncharacterized protein LOC117060067 [Lacerta agilis]